MIESAARRSSALSTNAPDTAVIAVQQISRAGLNPALAAAAAAVGDGFPNMGRVSIRVNDTYARVARTVTVASPLHPGVTPRRVANATAVASTSEAAPEPAASDVGGGRIPDRRHASAVGPRW